MRVNGHSIEVRINAEDPAKGFMPEPGHGHRAQRSRRQRACASTRMLYAGYTVPPFYDSLLGKLIVHDEDRASAIRRLDRALGELNIEGLATTKPLHQALVARPRRAGRTISYRWLEPWLASHMQVLIKSRRSRAAPTCRPIRPATAK